MIIDKSLLNYLSAYASRTALSSQENEGLDKIVQQISAEEHCARIGNSTYGLFEAILYTIPLLCVFPTSAICLAEARKRQLRQLGKQTTLPLYDLANGAPQSLTENMKAINVPNVPSPVHSVIQGMKCDSQRGLQLGRLTSHLNYGSVALRMFGCLPSLTVLTSFCVGGLVVGSFRIIQASLTVEVDQTELLHLSERLLSPPPPPPMRYDIIEKITNLLEILAIGLIYPCFSICLSTKRFSDPALRAAITERYVCEPSVGYPVAQNRPPLTMAAGSSFVKPKSQIPAKDLLEIPTFTRCQFYGSLKSEDRHERVFAERGSTHDSVLVSLDKCEIK
ncbi:unnamed protein product [Schistocephalus solidus]|uniref:Transmembrane protein n=1 Tax=Schistocephalus solidus TaxID=70667 RepID=A0A183SLL2_SCHSO|nr:unnamed protein product [Schistocephalus solidus]